MRIAAQLYTLRDHCKTPRDIAATLARVAKIGYRAVQASALGPIEPTELKKILDDNGMVCCATHEPWDALRNESARLIDKHAILDCRYTALGGLFPKPAESTETLWRTFAADFNAAAAKYRGSALRIGYHNHSHEFTDLADDKPGQTIYAMLADALSADCWFEPDTYWIAHGGAEPSAWIERLNGRVPCVHLKDLTIARNDRSHQMRPVGQGNLGWTRVIAACERAGAEWLIVEQDQTYGHDPFVCLGESLAFLQARGFSD